MARILSLTILLAAASPVMAEDTSTTMAALMGEKAECRYLMQLCSEVVSLTNSRAWDAATVRLSALVSASNVLKAKHDKTPVCLAECDALLEAATPK